MGRKLEENKELFNTWATTYDQSVKKPTGVLEGYNTSLKTAAGMVDHFNSGRILDIGIGTGNFTELFVTPETEVHGLDISDEMLKECQKKFPEFHLTLGEFPNIKYQHETFDLVISSFCFHEIPPNQRNEACREIYRILKPNGYVLLLDIMFVSTQSRNQAEAEVENWDPSEEYALVGDLNDILLSAGFSNVFWRQTAKYHWCVCAKKNGEKEDSPFKE
jgi:putative AdoMet-dependent methyltransferase